MFSDDEESMSPVHGKETSKRGIISGGLVTLTGSIERAPQGETALSNLELAKDSSLRHPSMVTLL